MKVSDVINSHEPLQSLFNQEMKVSLAFKMTKNLDQVSKVLELFNEARQKLVDEMSEGEEIKAGMEEEFSKSMTAILDEEVDIEPTKFAIEDLGDLTISPIGLKSLSWMVSDD